MALSRFSNVLRRVTTAGPYINERLSIVVLSFVVVAGIFTVAYADKSVASVSLVALYFLPLALSALVHPLRISLALSIVCVVLHNLLGPPPEVGARQLPRDVTILLGYLFVVVVVNQLGAQRRRLAELAERQRDALANEIQLAAEVQQNILPRSIPAVPGFEFAARMYPAKTVSGDYYGFIELPAGEIAVVIADVSGKGVAAGLLMPSIEVALRMDAPRFPNTSDLLHTFNNVVCQVTGGHRFISMFYGKLCPQSRSLEYANAGHNPPLLIRSGTEPRALDQGGPVLGVLPDSKYVSDRIELRQGDVLVLYTDGAVEAENPAGEQYSADRLSKTVSSHLRKNASELIETIHTSIVQFSKTTSLADDLTLVVLKTL
ncbi:MAG: PP2C family protein-serine/threonine phosphatase [Candidatus Sulfotelmatobacter sp.]|jgi:sigma-B regulation protein RsbU (phosphoserine phosphatase)